MAGTLKFNCLQFFTVYFCPAPIKCFKKLKRLLERVRWMKDQKRRLSALSDWSCNKIIEWIRQKFWSRTSSGPPKKLHWKKNWKSPFAVSKSSHRLNCRRSYLGFPFTTEKCRFSFHFILVFFSFRKVNAFTSLLKRFLFLLLNFPIEKKKMIRIDLL